MATTSNAAVRPSEVEHIGRLFRVRSLEPEWTEATITYRRLKCSLPLKSGKRIKVRTECEIFVFSRLTLPVLRQLQFPEDTCDVRPLSWHLVIARRYRTPCKRVDPPSRSISIRFRSSNLFGRRMEIRDRFPHSRWIGIHGKVTTFGNLGQSDTVRPDVVQI